MNKYLVINKYSGLNHVIDNVGVFTATSEDEARQMAATKWRVSIYNTFAHNIDEMEDGWSYYGS